MSIFTESEKNFLSSLGDDIFIESSKPERVKALNKTYAILEELGFTPKISKKSKIGWLNENNSGDFEESLCISIGQLKGLEAVCDKVNKEIKPLGAKVSPDNYGTIFLSMTDKAVTESYIGNYFRNKVLLHKLGKNPELNERTIIKFIKNLTLKYEESLLDEDVQKVMKKRDVADYYVPQAELNFPDGMVITFAFCYDKKSLTPGAAFKNGRNDYIVLLYPCFFDCRDMDVNVFTVMHEIGHIRLGHCELKNQSLDSQRRQKVMVKGGAIYTELNADLYASLNGAKMYTILKEGIDKDYDKNYDYRYTNNELSKRYSFVLKNYQKLRPMTESLETEICEYITESLKSDYRYEDFSSSSEVDAFNKVMKTVFDDDDEMSEKDAKKGMKMIYFKNKLVGYIGFSEYDIKGKKYLGIGNFVILPEYQRQGHGTAIIEDLIVNNKSKYDEIYCYVDKDNKKTIKFYDKIANVNKEHLNKDGLYYVSLYKESVIKESADDIFEESTVKEEDDIFYNKWKYENGDINLLFITGYSGGGKSTMSRDEDRVSREVVDMDRIVLFTNKSDEYFENLGSFAKQFMLEGPGKKYRTDKDVAIKNSSDIFRKHISVDMVKFAKSYAKENKRKKLVMEGVWIYRYIEPSDIDDCAVYIKGTSLKTSTERAIKRDSENMKKSGKNPLKVGFHAFTKVVMASKDVLLRDLEKYQDYFKEKYEKQKNEKYNPGKAIKNGIKGAVHDIAGAVKKHTESVEDIHDNWCYITESGESKRTAKTGEFEIEKVDFKVYNDRDYSYVTVKGIDKPLRGRSEVIIMKDDEVYLCFDNDRYRLPGGGWDKGESYEHAALRETKEEAKINCTNIKYCTSRVDVSDGVPDKCKKENIPEEGYWYGYFTKVFIAEYDKKFSGHVDKEDQDPSMVKTGKFYPFEEVKDQLYSEHKEAIEKYLGVNDEAFKEDALDDDAFDMIDVMLEAATDSHIIKDALYPPIEAVLKTRDGDKLFKRYVEEFIDRNTEKLHEPCPISLIPFTDNDKARFFGLFNLNEKECIKIIGQAADAVSSSANFRLVKQNPIFCVFYLVLRYYIINKDESGINSTLAIHALASYPSVFSKYFKYGANPGIMRYTADHLTEKFIFKQEGHVFGALRKSIEASYKFLKPYFNEAADKEMIRYIQRIRNDQNSLIKKIANEYQKNYKAGKSVSTQNETYDTGALIDDYNNDTSKAETASHSIIISLLTNGIDLRILETASEIAQLSISELRLYLVKILVDSRSTEIEDFISAVLFIYLYDEKHTMDEIKSKQFLSFGISLFRKTNSNDKNIATIKKTLDKWAEETGIHSRYKREPTRIAYKKGIYWYILLTIQTNL